MRYFMLQNSDGGTLDITTTEILFHEISELGFSENNEFRRVGPIWNLNHTELNQATVKGKMLFSEWGDTTPYQKFQTFMSFVSRAPLTLVYYPFGLNGQAYYRKVRVSNLSKSEINEYGVLDESIEFASYTPWYQIITQKAEPPEEDADAGWIWDAGNAWRENSESVPLAGSSRFKFGAEPITNVRFDCEQSGRVKLSIVGPITEPVWTHYANGALVATGGFDSNTPVTLTAGERLVVDNTGGKYSMTITDANGITRNVYSLRDFDRACFFDLKRGTNVISVASLDDSLFSFAVEGHIYYATV